MINGNRTENEVVAAGRSRSAERIRLLLKRLAWIVPLIVLMALLALGACFYLLYVRPQAEENALMRVQTVAVVTQKQLEKLVANIEYALLSNQEWSQGRLIEAGDARSFNHQIIPLIKRLPIRMAQLANDKGQAILLTKTEEGWANRLIDLPAKNGLQHWLRWQGSDARTLLGEEWRKEDWDPRQRPWYTGATTASEWQVVWTPPHVLQDSNEAVISVSTRWLDKLSRQWILSFSVDLAQLSHLSHLAGEQSLGEHGQMALVTADGRLLGLSSRDFPQNPEAIKKSILQEPAKLGLRILNSALLLEAKEGADRRSKGPQALLLSPKESDDGQSWLAGISPFTVGQQVFRVIALAPAAEFMVLHTERSLTFAVTIVLIVLFSLLAGLLMVTPVRQALTHLFASLVAKRQQAEKQVERRNTVAAITARMQQAQNTDELAYSLLCELASRLGLGYAIFCLWHEGEERLSLAASYAGEKTDEWKYEATGEKRKAMEAAINANLLGQCARDRRLTVLHPSGDDYVRVRSGLGDAAPVAIMIFPVQYAGRLFAMMELASLRDFSEDDRLLLTDLEPIIAMNLEILLRAGRTAELLAQTAANDEHHRLILGALDEGIWGMDIHGRAGFANRTAVEMLGFSEQEIVGRDLHSLVHARYPDGHAYPAEACPVCQTAHDGISRTVDDEVFWHKDGHAVPVEYTVTAIYRQDEITGVVVVFRNIGSRKEAELAMRGNEAMLWQLLEDSPIAMIISSEEGQLLKCNPPFSKLLGMTREFLETRLMSEFWEQPEERTVFVEQLKAEGFVHNYTASLRRGDGRLIRVLLNSRWWVQGTQRQGFSWITDIDEAGKEAARKDTVASTPALKAELPEVGGGA